jgi:hypothetical protein
MQVHIVDGWIYFCIALAIMMLTSIIMERQSRSFYTRDGALRKFSIMDLQLPASAQELANLIKGIYLLPQEMKEKSLRTLKGQLIIDFLFMPATYGAIFLLCMKVSWKMTGNIGQQIFAILAWAQIIAFIFDIIENIYLLGKIKPDVRASSKSIHSGYQKIVTLKWALALSATICSLSGIVYFWLVGRYSINSLQYLLIILGEIIVFFLIAKFMKSKKDDSTDTIVAV